MDKEEMEEIYKEHIEETMEMLDEKILHMQELMQRQELIIWKFEDKIATLKKDIAQLNEMLKFSAEIIANEKVEYTDKKARELIVAKEKSRRVRVNSLRIFRKEDIPRKYQKVIKFDNEGYLNIYCIVSGNNFEGYKFGYKRIEKGMGYYVKVSKSQAKDCKLGLRATFFEHINVFRCTVIEPGLDLNRFPNLRLYHSENTKWLYVDSQGKQELFNSGTKAIISDIYTNAFIKIIDCNTQAYIVLDEENGNELGALNHII